LWANDIHMNQEIIKEYEQRVTAARQQLEKYQKLISRYSLMRLTVFAGIVLAIYIAVTQDDFNVLIVLFILLTLLFAWLVSRQSKFELQKQYYTDHVKVCQNEIANILKHDNIYANGVEYADDKHHYTADLDIFGNSSLFQLANRSATIIGRDKLADWLKAPADKPDVLLRQDAVKELATKNDWKLDVQTLLLFANNHDNNQLKQLFTYLHMPLNLSGERWLSKYCKIAPLLLIGLLVLAFFYPIAKAIAILLALLHGTLIFSKAKFIRKADLIAGKIGSTLSSFAAVFLRIESETWQAELNKQIAGNIKNSNGGSTSNQIKELATLIDKLNYHSNMIVGAILNVFLLWDIRQIIAIENWKRNNTESLESAFEVVGEYEALLSLAGLHINYPLWAIPAIADGDGYTVTASDISHPLINNGYSVSNSFELDNTYKIDIITGSNMAGKSTFLRTIGINTVLALAGAPVCAAQMQVSVVSIVSYMRIKDSLNESTSTFKAELDRLQMLLKAVEEKHNVYFLIDEMLRGTNSVDKYLGSKAVIEQLIKKRGVGLVATHDLQIARLEDKYPEYVRNFYFDIQVKDGEMLFDYKIKHGECKTFNASLLLKQIGIDIEG
jgi:hypothetical protein